MKILPFVFPVLLLLSGSFANALSLPFAQPKLVKVPGTKVSLVPPAGLKPSARFPGFMDEETSSSILITEMPAPYSEIANGFTKEALVTRGMKLLSRREVSLNGRPGILLHVGQETRSIAFLKWMVVTGNEKETVLVTATFPARMKAQLSSAMEKSALSVQWDAAAKIDPLAGLNFSFKDDPSLKFARRVSNMVIMTKNGALPGKPTNDPFFIIGPSVSQAPISDIKIFAERRLVQIEEVSGIAVKKQSDVTIDGLSGSAIVAEARWKDLPGAPVVVYQVLLLDGKNYFLMQGVAPREEQEKYLAVFTRIAQSFRKK
ncbi:MAG TPA: hypothetical protein VG324_28165 [Blastocatellia bacterium]|nr:hypothetical protein [Blastocatellia bacterium]